MKRILQGLLLAGVLTAIFSIGTLAADLPAEAGMYQPEAETNVTITPQKADGTVITAASDYYYAGAERFDVTVTGLTAKAWYLLLVVEGENGTLPTAGNIVYIDQATADDAGAVTFHAYPSRLTRGSYCVYAVGAGKAIDLNAPTAWFRYYTPGVTVSGRVTSYNASNAATVQLMQGGTAKYSATVTGTDATFSIENVAPGTYDLVVTKAGHLKYTVKGVVVGDGGLDLTAHSNSKISTIALLCGDINGDGNINTSDINVIYQANNYYKSATDKDVDVVADLNGDGIINTSDINIIYESANYYKGTADCTVDY